MKTSGARSGARKHIHTNEQCWLILQTPEIEDVEVANIRVDALDYRTAQEQARCPHPARKHDGAAKGEGVSVARLDRG